MTGHAKPAKSFYTVALWQEVKLESTQTFIMAPCYTNISRVRN